MNRTWLGIAAINGALAVMAGAFAAHGLKARLSGSITVTYDPAVQPYLATLKLSNPGGPKPVLKQAPVPALW